MTVKFCKIKIDGKSNLNKTEFECVERLLDKATNKQLYKILTMVEKEIRLSETSIREGFEKK